MKTLRKVGIFFLLVFLLGTITACGRKNEKVMNKEISFAFWGYPEADKVYAKIVEDFEKKFPDIKVNLLHFSGEYYVKIQTMMAGGIAPDIIWLDDDNYQEYVNRGVVLDLNPFIEKDKFELSGFYPNLVDTYRYKKGLYGIPKGYNLVVFFYNKDLFDKEGFPYPSDNWTWEEFLEKAKRLTKDTNGDGKIDQFGFGWWEGDDWQALIWENGGEIFNEDMTECLIDSPEAVEALEFWVDVWKKYHISPSPQMKDVLTPLFMTGKVAITSGAHPRLIDYRNIKDFKIDIASFPMGKKKVIPIGSGCFSITNQSKYPEAAWEFVKYLTSPPASTLTFEKLGDSCSPRMADKYVFDKIDSFLDHRHLFYEEIKFGRVPRVRSYVGGRGEIGRILVDNLDILWLGEKSAKEAAYIIKVKIDEILKKGGTK